MVQPVVPHGVPHPVLSQQPFGHLRGRGRADDAGLSTDGPNPSRTPRLEKSAGGEARSPVRAGETLQQTEQEHQGLQDTTTSAVDQDKATPYTNVQSTRR